MFLTALVIGCQKQLEITSDTTWSGSINNTTVDGSGNKTFDIDDNSCAVFQKQTSSGRLKLKVKGGIFGGGEEGETTAEYGVVSVCAGDGL